MKILAIEDQPVAALLLAGTLRSLGHEVDLADSAPAADQKLATGGYRVVVSDWRMPGVDGLELCQLIRRRGGDYVYFILISSSRVTKKNRQLALEAGVDDFLTKPVDADELGMRLHVAKRILRLSTDLQELRAFLPICVHCKKVRDDKKYWTEIELYFNKRQGTQFSHGVCPDCYEREVIPQLEQLGISAEAASAPLPSKP